MKNSLKFLTACFLALIITLSTGLLSACDNDDEGASPVEFDRVVYSVSIGAIELINSEYTKDITLDAPATNPEKPEDDTLTPPTEEEILEIKRHFVFADKQTEVLNSNSGTNLQPEKIKSGVYKYEISIDDDLKFDYTRTEIRKDKCIIIKGSIISTVNSQEIEYLLSASFEADWGGKKIKVDIKAPKIDEGGQYIKENDEFVYNDGISFHYETTDISSAEYRGKFRYDGEISFRADLSFLTDDNGKYITKFITMPKDGIIEYVFNKIDATNYQAEVKNKPDLIDSIWVDIVKNGSELTVTYHTPTPAVQP